MNCFYRSSDLLARAKLWLGQFHLKFLLNQFLIYNKSTSLVMSLVLLSSIGTICQKLANWTRIFTKFKNHNYFEKTFNPIQAIQIDDTCIKLSLGNNNPSFYWNISLINIQPKRVFITDESCGINFGHSCLVKKINKIHYFHNGWRRSRASIPSIRQDAEPATNEFSAGDAEAADLWPINRACGAHFIKRQTHAGLGAQASECHRARIQQFMQVSKRRLLN